MKRILTFILTVCLIATVLPIGAVTASAQTVDGWYTEGEYWVYYENGVKVTNAWREDSNGWCYLGEDGYMLTDTFVNDSTGKCYLNSSGYCVVSDWVTVDEKRYYLDQNCHTLTGWQEMDDATYYFFEDGSAARGWNIIDDKRYMFDTLGKMIKGAKDFIIDISRWQGNIDWDKLSTTGIDGVIARCGHGNITDGVGDIKFEEYVAEMNARGIPYGMYHYNKSTTVEDARIEAENVIKYVKSTAAAPTLPFFIDIEESGGKADLIAIAKVYIEEFIKNGYMPGIYANKNYWNNYLNDPEFDLYYKWIASYGSDNGYPSSSFANSDDLEKYGMWQYTSAGRLSGITENTVDCNILFDWFKKADGWYSYGELKYYFKDGNICRGLHNIDGVNYYFGQNGLLTGSGWSKDDKGWCYVGTDGDLVTNAWVEDSKGLCYLGSDGYLVTNRWILATAGWYYLDEDGRIAKNAWISDSSGWCYVGDDGLIVTNCWVKDTSGWCYVGSDGYTVKNKWIADSKGWCYLGSDGVMLTNRWIMDSQGWCYVGADGYCVTNIWIKDSKGWCYLNQDGRMAVNQWIKDSQGWCYVDADGYCLTNSWVKDSVGWCYLNGNGNMTVNEWVFDGGNWYYCNAAGYMVTGLHNIGGVNYWFNSSGVWIA